MDLLQSLARIAHSPPTTEAGTLRAALPSRFEPDAEPPQTRAPSTSTPIAQPAVADDVHRPSPMVLPSPSSPARPSPVRAIAAASSPEAPSPIVPTLPETTPGAHIPAPTVRLHSIQAQSAGTAIRGTEAIPARSPATGAKPAAGELRAPVRSAVTPTAQRTALRSPTPLRSETVAAHTRPVDTPAPIIHVTIDRLEVRAPAAASTPPVPRRKPATPSVSLGDYLRGAGGNPRGAP